MPLNKFYLNASIILDANMTLISDGTNGESDDPQ